MNREMTVVNGLLEEICEANISVGQRLPAVPVAGHQAGFRARKKGGKSDQDKQRGIKTA